MGRTKADKPSGSPRGEKRKVIPSKKFDDIKAPRKSLRSEGKMPAAEYRKAVELGYKQPTINMHGGVGIPGKRTKEAVQKLHRLDFTRLNEELSPILDKSKAVREKRERGESIETIRKEVKLVNRQVVYKEGASDVHSLHVGNDIAAVSNGRVSKVYDYPDLAPKLDKRLANATNKGKTYWASDLPLDQRRSHIAQGFQHLVGGNNEEAQKSFAQAGLTDKGQKWVNKMGTLMLAERGRELHGGSGANRVHDALGHVVGDGKSASKSFSDVFVKEADKLAPFAQRGGAKTLK
ncbi:hypothetical protein RKE25_04390 [Dyella sp. BiH032]|uniref:hypothetical protein n=1 Tax=Dyella sp. BiH032 TaxID=3075430 RepID=UPI0028930059|nr:hypothetical protein [Dyella sp. BiH032]WNL46885.1 hypothetical protein RKE25_04390 [Dyella sp. BiH032]